MTRQEQLNTYLIAVRSKRFRPGSHDCGHFVAGWVEVATGVDHGAAWRDAYISMQEAAERLTGAGYEDHVDLVASILPETPPAFARVGDLAVVDGRALGIVASDRVFVLRPDGLGHVSRLRALRAFSVNSEVE